jgi:hypothetical protein
MRLGDAGNIRGVQSGGFSGTSAFCRPAPAGTISDGNAVFGTHRVLRPALTGVDRLVVCPIGSYLGPEKRVNEAGP